MYIVSPPPCPTAKDHLFWRFLTKSNTIKFLFFLVDIGPISNINTRLGRPFPPDKCLPSVLDPQVLSPYSGEKKHVEKISLDGVNRICFSS